jgi:hypothetical protein
MMWSAVRLSLEPRCAGTAACGDDTLRTRDGFRDTLFGNRGFDRAHIDRGLDIVRSVEAFF